MRDLYELAVVHLGQLPYEMIRRVEADGGEYQLWMALAMLRIRNQEQAIHLRRDLAAARTPPKWRRIHTSLDRAAAALANRN